MTGRRPAEMLTGRGHCRPRLRHSRRSRLSALSHSHVNVAPAETANSQAPSAKIMAIRPFPSTTWRVGPSVRKVAEGVGGREEEPLAVGLVDAVALHHLDVVSLAVEVVEAGIAGHVLMVTQPGGRSGSHARRSQDRQTEATSRR